jgi:hypothetical protein
LRAESVTFLQANSSGGVALKAMEAKTGPIHVVRPHRRVQAIESALDARPALRRDAWRIALASGIAITGGHTKRHGPTSFRFRSNIWNFRRPSGLHSTGQVNPDRRD